MTDRERLCQMWVKFDHPCLWFKPKQPWTNPYLKEPWYQETLQAYDRIRSEGCDYTKEQGR